MNNYIRLRPHHLLCLPGYKGHAYSKVHANSWDRISNSLAQYPDMRVKIANGKDTLCTTCPNNGSGKSICNEKTLSKLDEKVKLILDLKENVTYKYGQLQQALKKIMTLEKHEELCGKCQWRVFGLCKDTFVK